MSAEPDPRFLGGESTVITDTSQMALVVAVGFDGAADVRCQLAKPEAARLLRAIADSFDPPTAAYFGVRGIGGEE